MKRAFTLIEVCISISVLVTAATGAVVLIRKCQPTYKCCTDPELDLNNPTNHFCVAATRNVIKANGWVAPWINFACYSDCMRYCSTNYVMLDTQAGEVDIVLTCDWPSPFLSDWRQCGTLTVSDDGDWMQFTCQPTSRVQFFTVAGLVQDKSSK